jgi:hypothetical protein
MKFIGDASFRPVGPQDDVILACCKVRQHLQGVRNVVNKVAYRRSSSLRKIGRDLM